MTVEDLNLGFGLADGRAYMLDGGFAATSRLNLQFYLWKEALKFNIHPSIPIASDGARIADIATGTSSWLLDLSKELTTADLEGFDINIAQGPFNELLPGNVKLMRWNIFDEVPESLIGRYDIIHLRLLILVVQDSDPSSILRKVFKMLKPGGYIQWDDLDYPGTCLIKTKGTASKAFDKLRSIIYSNGRHDWVLQLPQLLEEQGFIEARAFHFVDEPQYIKANGDQHLLTMQEFASRLAAEGKLTESQSLLRLLQDAWNEVNDGVALSMPKQVCVAQRPRR